MCLSVGLYLRCEILYKTCFSGQLRMASSESDTIFAMTASNVAGNTIFGITLSLNEPQFKAAIVKMETNSLQLLILNYLRRVNGSNQTQLRMLFCSSRSWKSFYYLSNHSKDGPKVVTCVSPFETNYSCFFIDYTIWTSFLSKFAEITLLISCVSYNFTFAQYELC